MPSVSFSESPTSRGLPASLGLTAKGLDGTAPGNIDPALVSQRRLLVGGLVMLIAAPAVMMMADLHWRAGFDAWKIVHLVLFSILFLLVAFGTAQAILGFTLRRRGGDRFALARSLPPDDGAPLRARVALVMPICNEEVGRVMEGVRVICESVAATGRLPECDFFLLSDTTDPNHLVEEEASWLALSQRLSGARIFYRKRRIGTNKKAGNIADFCRRWGNYYRYMVVLDADSIISGRAVVDLVRVMEHNRGVGILQAVPALAQGETILARLQQFATALYGPVFSAGLSYWHLGESNYWGHNAIIRVAPFIRHCSLPELPGDGPFGGRILSHDYVEAALMRRAGWEVWLAPEIGGNYEECPANLIDFAKRDRRWLQGNLQHARLVVARGFRPMNRLHFALGILSYLGSPLWLAFTLLSMGIAAQLATTGLTLLPRHSFSAMLPWSFGTQAACLFAYTMLVLFLPKLIAFCDLLRRPAALAAFGGARKVAAGIGFETVVYTLLAPILMAFHTRFVVLTLCRRNITWGTQRRGRAGQSAWGEAVSAHAGHTLMGLVGAGISIWISPYLALWMSPLLLGLIGSIPLSYVTGTHSIGQRVQARGLLMTPEESSPPEELQRLSEHLARRGDAPASAEALRADYGLLQVILDPYVNAAHLALLREKDDGPSPAESHFTALRQRLLLEGPAPLAPREKLSLLLDANSMRLLHDEIWRTPADRLSAWWRQALQHYAVIAPAPETAFTR